MMQPGAYACFPSCRQEITRSRAACRPRQEKGGDNERSQDQRAQRSISLSAKAGWAHLQYYTNLFSR